MGGDRGLNTRALVAWKSRELAILLSLRNDPPSLDIPSADRQWTCEHIRARNLAVRCLSCDQRYSDLAISLDGRNPALETQKCLDIFVRFKQKPFSHWTTGENENQVAISALEAARSNLAGTALFV
jgi:hypothetical protein